MGRRLGNALPPATATFARSAETTRVQNRDGWEQIYTHESQVMPEPAKPLPVRSSIFQPVTVLHSGFSALRNPTPIFRPRNLASPAMTNSTIGQQQGSFKAATQVEQFPGAEARTGRMNNVPQWRRALAYPRATVTAGTYPVDSRG